MVRRCFDFTPIIRRLRCCVPQLIFTLAVLNAVNMSRVYHYIRGQSVMKLYVIFNMLQVSSSCLLCSLNLTHGELSPLGLRAARRFAIGCSARSARTFSRRSSAACDSAKRA